MPSPIDMIGKTVSHYRVLEKLGGGGMGVVYRAEDTRLRRTVALKFLPPELTRDENAKARFVQEAQAASALDHPNICTVHEIDETPDGQMFLALAYYDGETLKKRIQRGPRPIEDVVDIGCQIAEGLAKAHAHGIVHRDIKPANIMVTRDGLAKIVDFGLAKLPEATGLTLAGLTVGTLAYMAPEQARGESVDHRADIWALGVLLYEMVTGRRPFHAHSAEALMYAILHGSPTPMHGVQPTVPVDFERIVIHALAKDVAARYQHADDLLADLRALRRRFQSSSVAANVAARSLPSVAVLPFSDMSPQSLDCPIVSHVGGGNVPHPTREPHPPVPASGRSHRPPCSTSLNGTHPRRPRRRQSTWRRSRLAGA
jgi:serine/threonine protein kinase